MREHFDFLHDAKEAGGIGLEMACGAENAQDMNCSQYASGSNKNKNNTNEQSPETPTPTQPPSNKTNYKEYAIIGGVTSYIISSGSCIFCILMIVILLIKKK